MPEQQITDTRSWSDAEYQRYSLQGVSRTFALTIPQLPAALETAVGNGYLLCRIADTIEDATELTAEQKQSFSGLFIRVVQGAAPAADFAQQLSALLGHETPVAERDLIQNTERVIRITRGLSTPQQLALSRCITIMLEGMAYFQGIDTQAGLADMQRFNSYCYHVAGVVGEMLTDLYSEYDESISQHRNTMMPLAVSFGQGLQMTNILKDIWDDQERGACWLPQSLMRKHGIDPEQFARSQGTPQFAALLQDMLAIAHHHLRNALRYTLLIPAAESGMRRFCLWAIGMALLTLQRLQRKPEFTSGSQVKISRQSLKLTIALCNTFTQSDLVLRGLFRLAAWGLPGPAPAESPDMELRVAYHLPSAQGPESAAPATTEFSADSRAAQDPHRGESDQQQYQLLSSQ